ncbi:uncharacterized protein LOC129962587 isoform X2 [Argiope bruennichi]|uniref:uncharacterized protein LOC129962587 isoform X2 n=1 Tax=Argiope bruennichi TaxID=94029 RepID=UPI002494601E|nr:uncharacterized protein LOC129962587 isoform X2 [Argiope bruennichi]
MWNKLSQAAGLASVESEEEKTVEKAPAFEDFKERLQQQEILVQQLKDLVRENEKRFQEKSKEYDELSSKFQKFKFQSKAKISHLSSQIKEQDKPKKEDCDFDDTSSSDSSDQSRRGKMLLLKKQLEQAKQQLEKKEQESKTIVDNYEKRINDLELQLNEKNNLISSLVGEESKAKEAEVDKSPKKESNVQEMYAQVVYKDAKIMELNNQILEHEKKIMDLQEHIREKDEVLQQRNRAVQLMAEDMSRKGKSVVDELDETREQMKIMQENFSTAESDWKMELEKYKLRISDLENEITDYDKKLKNSEATIKSIENAKYELTVKNAELQKKIVCVQESAAKQCELYNKEIEGEVEALKKNLEAEKQHAAELQKALDESSSQSDNKVLKARVKERTKYKALERELNELKKNAQQKPEEIIELQQCVAELEEEKGSLQLKLMDFEEQVIQIDKLKEENETLKDTVQGKLNEVQSLGKRINEIQSEKDNFEAKFKSLQESYKDLEGKFHNLIEEKSKLEEHFSTVSNSKEEIAMNYNKLKEEYSNMQSTYNDIAENLQQLQDQKVTFELKNIELEEIRESDEKTKKELLAEIEQLKESFYSESKPDIQLEKENSEIKEELRIMSDKLKNSEDRISELLSDINKLQEKLENQHQKHSSEIEELNNKIKTLEDDYNRAIQELESKTNECVEKEKAIQELESDNKKVIQDLESKVKECVEKEKIINELESHYSSVQNQLSDFYSCIGAKNLSDCKKYAIQKTEEYSNLKNDYDKEIKEKANMLICLQEKDEELHRCNLKIDKLQSILENRDAELKSFETVIEKLKETVSEKENIISKISSDLEEKMSSEKLLFETIQEKTQLLSNSEEILRNLKLELQTLKDTQLVYQEKMKANSSSLLGQITDLETELDALRDELTSKIKVIDELNEIILNLKKENENVHSELREKERLIQEKDGAIKNFESVTQFNKDEINSLKQERERIKAEILVKDSYVMELNEKLQQLENELETQEAELNTLRNELKSKTKNIDELNEIILSLRNENEKIHSELEEVENLIWEKNNIIEDYESADKANKDEINFLKDEIECIKEEIFDKDSEINVQNQRLQLLESEFKAITNEFSCSREEFQNLIETHSVNEETIKLLKERNSVLEREKLHSNMAFTEKDEAYKKVLTEKTHLESEFLKLQDEKESLDALLKEKAQELDIVNSAINKLTNLIASSDSKIVQDFLSELSDKNSNLKQLGDKYFSFLKSMQNDVDLLSSENSALQSKIEEMRIVVNDQQMKVQESNSIIDALQKESSDKHKEFEKRLNALTDSKSTLENQIIEFRAKVDSLTNENDSLRNNLNSLQEGHALEISTLNEKISGYDSELRIANEKIKAYEDDNSKLCDSLKDSIRDYKIKEENYEKQICDLSEINETLEKKLQESESEIRDCKEKITTTEMDAVFQNARFADELAGLEISHQMLISSRENLEITISELRSQIAEYENEISSFKQSVSELEEKVLEKENQMIDLQDQLKVQAEKLTDLQSLFDQKSIENEKYKHLIDTQFPCLQSCRQHYYMMVSALLSSFQIDTDISFLEKDEWESVDEFSVKSKNVIDRVVEHSVEVQSLKSICNSLESKVESLEEENKSLLSLCYILRNFLTGLSNSVQSSLKENDTKFNVILSSFQNKETVLESLKSKILNLSKKQSLSKSHFHELEAEKNSYLEKLKESEKSLTETEQIINALKIENEEVKRQNVQLVDQYETKIFHLEDITRKYNDLCEAHALQRNELQSAYAKIQEFHTLMSNKDEKVFQLVHELETSKGALNTLQSELSIAHSTISSLQNEINQLNKQVSDYEEESRVLESSNNVSNGLQMEVENLKRELSSCEEEKNYLQQHIDNANSQIQTLLTERASLESTIGEMQYKLDNLTEINLNLSNSLEESKLLIAQNEEKIRILVEQNSNFVSMHEKVCEELNSLKSAKDESQSKERIEFTNKISLLEKSRDNLINALIKINNFVSNVEIPDCDFPSTDLEDETSKKIILELQKCLLQSRKHFYDEINSLKSKFEATESQNKQLCEELEKVKEEFTASQKVKDTVKIEEQITPVSREVKVGTDVFQQASSKIVPSSEPLTTSEQGDPSQKREADEYKIKFAKVLSRLKVFKDKNEKLTNEIQELKNQISELEEAKLRSTRSEQELVADLNKVTNENKELRDALQSVGEKHRSELNKANDKILQLKERNSILDEECCRIRKELQEYKHTWEQANVSYELQKEDNERLREKLKETAEQSGELKTKISELNNQLMQLKNENIHLHQEAENLREHANMLLSDNDTYQDLIEKLTSSKTSLEQKLSNLTEKFNAELKSLQHQHELELQNLKAEPREIADISQSKELEKELISLKEMCSEMQQHIEKLEKERDISLRNQNLLEKEKVYLQHQLLEKADELQKTKNYLDDVIKNKTSAAESISSVESPKFSPNETLVHEISELKEENKNLKSQLNSVMQELNLTNENFEIMKQDFYNKENYYVDRIKLLETQQGRQEVSVNIPHDQKSVSDAVRLESELQQAMSSLHKQGLRCEELSLEVSKLLEERNILRWKLQQYGQVNPEVKSQSEIDSGASTSDLISVKVESPSMSQDVAALHARLRESEKTCQQLRQANEALDRALITERDQKKMIEEELDLAKEHLSEEAKASDEYQILLGEINEPEFFAETNFSVSRNIRPYVYRLRRWFRGRRNYLCRTVKSRNYPQLVYIFYIFFIHIWLLTCVFS